jgi:hypothetical protein
MLEGEDDSTVKESIGLAALARRRKTIYAGTIVWLVIPFSCKIKMF